MSTRKSSKGRKTRNPSTPNDTTTAATRVALTTELAFIMERADEETLTDVVFAAVWNLSKRFGNWEAWNAVQSAALASGWDFDGGGVDEGARVGEQAPKASVAS